MKELQGTDRLYTRKSSWVTQRQQEKLKQEYQRKLKHLAAMFTANIKHRPNPRQVNIKLYIINLLPQFLLLDTSFEVFNKI